MAGAKKNSGSPGPLDMRSESAFLECLAAALQRSGEGHPNALMHLDVARAEDIRSHCGKAGVHALQDLVEAMVHNQLGPRAPVHLSNTCGLSLLVPEVLPTDAVILARRLRGAIDNGTFTWHGHPFRLGAHIGLVELGPTPADPQMWIRLVREACRAARELGGSGIQMVELSSHAWSDLEQEREWHDHLTEVI